MTARMTEKDQRRFLAKVGLPDENGCVPWLACIDNRGYGRFRIQQRAARAHRLMHELMIGPIPAGLEIDHICGVRACVAPLHLRAVTSKQNNENRVGPMRNSTTGVRGVFPNGDKWRAAVGHNSRLIWLGTFDRLEDADAAARAARDELFTHNDRDRVAS